MEIHAAYGPFPDWPVERYLRDAHHMYTPAGSRTFSFSAWGR